MALATLLLARGPLTAEPLIEDQVLVDFGSTWRFHDGDVDLGAAWREPGYDDSRWASGPGLLGYDTRGSRDDWPEPGLRTELEPHRITYYFRLAFEYDGPLDGIVLSLDQIVDDAAIYYLNGAEIGRSELMPAGEVGFGTRASSWTNPALELDVLAIEPGLLRQGRNVLAASVHNHAEQSSDICFGVRLRVLERTQSPAALYLTWQRDPTTTMTVQWHAEPGEEAPHLEYGPPSGDELVRIPGTSRPMAFSGRPVFTAELTGLEPGTSYRFRIARAEPGRNSPFYSFRTMPAAADRPIRIAIGGDVRHDRAWMERTNRHVLRFDPEFVVWGGDLAYADGRADRIGRWEEFFSACLETLVDERNRVVPIVTAIGNHEVAGGYYWGHERGREAFQDTDEFRASIAPFFYSLFAFPGHPGYGVLDFGDYLSLILLDTDHSGPIEGRQTEWLRRTLAQRARVPHLIPVYHVPAYPSVRAYDAGVSTRVRQHWAPLFEDHGVRVAFEHHDHAYKRTVPIRREREDPEGVVYVGDGAWGVSTREVHAAAETWYLTQSRSTRHFILATIHGGHLDLKVIDEEGQLIDHYVPRSGR